MSIKKWKANTLATSDSSRIILMNFCPNTLLTLLIYLPVLWITVFSFRLKLSRRIQRCVFFQRLMIEESRCLMRIFLRHSFISIFLNWVKKKNLLLNGKSSKNFVREYSIRFQVHRWTNCLHDICILSVQKWGLYHLQQKL